jgi:formate-dependent nitrite reductase membrane component NrfD
MNLFVSDPHWGWWIVLYFYCGGIAAGSYFVAALIDVFGREEDRGLARLGYRIAFPLVMLCALFLILDLDRPERFWHMLLQSEVVDRAGEEGWGVLLGAVMFKYWSPMSVGAWALLVFGVCSFVSFLASLWPDRFLGRLLRRPWFSGPFHLVATGVGFFIACYTGALLTATNQPVWSASEWLAPLLLTSAGSTGMATLLLLGGSRPRVVPVEALGRLERADLWALVLELFVFVIFLVSLGSVLAHVWGAWPWWVFIVGTGFVGLLLPLALHLRLLARGPGRFLGAAVLVLVGGFLLRFGLLMTPPYLLSHGAAVSRQAGLSFSPEDRRPRGGGPGASDTNRPATLLPGNRVLEQK